MANGTVMLRLGTLLKGSRLCSDGRPAWPIPPSMPESNALPSGIVFSSDGPALEQQKDSASGLKEHDYIGLAESSTFQQLEAKKDDELRLGGEDLQLELGLGLGTPSTQRNDCEKYADSLLKQKDCTLKAQKEGNSTPNIEAVRYKVSEAAATLQKPWQNAASVTTEESTSSNWTSQDYQIPIKVSTCVRDPDEGHLSAGISSFHGPSMKNGTKRGYTEAMHDAARFNIASGVTAAGKVAEGEAKTLSKLQQGSYLSNYVPSKPSMSAQWMVGSENSSIHAFVSRNEKMTGENVPRPFNTPGNCKDFGTNVPTPPKGQVVGWPPIRSYRKQNIAKPTEMFVKVNMDGITVGRKVDLNAHRSYECLYLALEEMFQLSSSGGKGTSQSVQSRESHVHEVKQSRLLNGSEYVLTYEDQDGDWMMVGDVPWGMFVNMVRRLRITRKSEATGLAPTRRSEIVK